MNKYHNNKVIINGIKFDSKKESEYYLYLKSLLKEGKIKDLKLQTRFELQPSFKLNNKTIRAITYKADFTFYDANNKYHIVDVKSEFTRKQPVYKLKKKMFQYIYELDIEEIV